MSDELPEPTIEKPDETPIMSNPVPNQGEVKKKNKKDFWLGVGIFFVLNIVMAILRWGLLFAFSGVFFSALDSSSAFANIYSIGAIILGFSPYVINIGLMIYFSVTNRGQIALGMLAGFGIALAIAICLGVLFMAVCFGLLATYN